MKKSELKAIVKEVITEAKSNSTVIKFSKLSNDMMSKYIRYNDLKNALDLCAGINTLEELGITEENISPKLIDSLKDADKALTVFMKEYLKASDPEKRKGFSNVKNNIKGDKK